MEKDLLFFLGKGGVGKSTMSSTTALKLSKTGKKVLIVSLDPAHNLSDIFEKEIGNNIIPVNDNLDAMEIVLSIWVKNYLKESQKEIKANYSYTNAFTQFDRYIGIMKYSPGTEEYAVLWGIEHIYDNYADKYDFIVFDTPPTGLTLRFLAMPSISKIWIEELSKMREDILKKRRLILKFNPDASVVKGARDKKEDRVYNKLQNINLQLGKMHELFTQHSVINVVVNPDELSLNETLRIRDELDKLGINIKSIILNKLREWHTDIVDKINTTFEKYPIFYVKLLEKGVNGIKGLDEFDLKDFMKHLNLY